MLGLEKLMSGRRHLVSLVVALGLAACSTPYQATFLTGGYSEKQLEADVWRVEFGGNGFTTQETVQTYWLYRSAQLTLDKGYEGFEIVSSTSLVRAEPPAVQIAAAAGGHTTYHPVYIPTYTGGDYGPKPTVVGDIRLLKAPIQPKPPKVFDAAQLKSTLEPYVNGQKCDMGNVCAHVHRYLVPDTQTASAATGSPSASAAPLPSSASSSAGAPKPQSRPASPPKSSTSVAADFATVVEFHCPASGTRLKTSARSQLIFADGSGLRCTYSDETGQKHERYALFADAYGDAARKELDALWPLKVGNRVDYDVSGTGFTQAADRYGGGNKHETFAVTRRERITVPPGVFDTFVVEWTEQETGRPSPTGAMVTMWYAPAVGYVVKSAVRMLGTNEASPFSATQYAGLTFDATEIAMPNGQPLPVATQPPPASIATPIVAPAALPESGSPADRLITLKRLLDEKLITREEYDKRRKAILDGL
jgi:hypothetical protein